MWAWIKRQWRIYILGLPRGIVMAIEINEKNKGMYTHKLP